MTRETRMKRITRMTQKVHNTGNLLFKRKIMKKYICIILTSAIFAALISGCSPKTMESGNTTSPAQTTETAETVGAAEATEVPPGYSPSELEPATIRLGGLRGPTSMGMVKLLKDAWHGDSYNTYEFSLAGSADEITPKLINGELDIAAVPANLASIIYNNSGGIIKLLAINTLGVLYIVENGDTVISLADLEGKTIYATGRGSVPEYVLRYLLFENSIDPDNDVNIEWKSEPTEVVSLMALEQGGIAMLPQPYVVVAQGAIDDLRIAADLTKEWEALDNGSMLITGVLVVRSDFADEHPDQITRFLEEYRASTEFVNANISEAAILSEEFDIIKAAIAEEALPFCNIVFYAGEDMKNAMGGYLQVLFDQNQQSVGGSLPDDSFYYGA